MALTVEERFWSRVAPSDGCWEWQGSRYASGHGRFWPGGGKAYTKMVRAHRFAYELVHGPIRDGKYVLHRCDNAPCVRPDHLELGDQAKNVHDMWLRNRVARGRSLPQARLTPGDVASIRQLAKRGMSQRQIARHFGVSRGAIDGILRGLNWTWV